MELRIWSKTFLNVYRSLDKIAEAIDRIVLTSGLSSGMNEYSGNAYYIANKIIELTERKIVLINLKLLIEEVLNKLDKNSVRLLMLKYVDRVRTEDIADLMHVSKRTFFRKSNKAITSFELTLSRLGQTSKSISIMLEDEAWIKDLYQRLIKQEIVNITPKNKRKTKPNKQKEQVNEDKLFNLACNSYKKLETSSMYI